MKIVMDKVSEIGEKLSQEAKAAGLPEILRPALVFRFLGCIAAFIMLAQAVWLFGVPYFLNKYLSAEVIEQELRSKAELNTVVLGLNYKTYSDFSLAVSASKFSVQQAGKTVVDLNGGNLRLKVLPILFNKFYINNSGADYLMADIVRDKKGEINILKLLPKAVDTKVMPDIKAMKLNLKKYNISYTDEAVKHTVIASGDYFKVNEYISDKKLSVDAIGQIFADTGSCDISKGLCTTDFSMDVNTKLPLHKNIARDDFNFNLWVNNLDLKAFSPFTRYLKGSQITGLEGVITGVVKTLPNKNGVKNINGNIITSGVSVNEKGEGRSAFLREKSVITFNSDIVGEDLLIRSFNLKTIYHNVDLGGKILNIDSKKPRLDLVLKLHNDIRSMIYNAYPSELDFDDGMMTKIKKYKPKATVDGQITIKGDALEPDIRGEFHGPDLFIDMPVANKAKADLRLVFVGKQLRVLADVVVNKGAHVFVDGLCDMYGDKSSVFDIKSTKNVDLPTTRAVLMPIQDTFMLDFGILNQMTIYGGHGDAKLYIDGTRDNATVDGHLNFEGGKATLDDLSAYIEDISGNLVFKKKDAVFGTNSASVKGDPIKISGKANLDGDFDIDVASHSISPKTLLEILTQSKMLEPAVKTYKELALLEDVSGKSDFKINLKGNFDKKPANMSASDFVNAISIDKIDYKGALGLKNNTVKIMGVGAPITVTTANAEFDKVNVKAKLNTKILNSHIDVDALLNPKRVRVYALSKKFLLRDAILLGDKKGVSKKIFSDKLPQNATCIRFNSLYDAPAGDFNPQYLNLDANIYYDGSGSSKGAQLYATQGKFVLRNGQADIDKLYLNIFGSLLSLDGTVKNLFAQKPDYNLVLDVKNFDISNVNNFADFKITPPDVKKIISAYGGYTGLVNGRVYLKKSGIDGNLSLKDVNFVHKKLQLPISVVNADVNFKNSSMTLKSLNALIDEVPFYMDLTVSNLTKKPYFRGYMTTNIYPSFVNKYVNANIGYPVKVKGEVLVKAYFKGALDALKSTIVVDLPQGADLSYMGAAFDETDFERELKVDTLLMKNSIDVNEVTYSKYVQSQSGVKTKYPYITARGHIMRSGKDGKQLYFDNFHVKTLAKTGSKFFNILFKKSILKYGDFECDLKINGSPQTPRVIGFVKFKNLDIPLYETVVKDIFADFKPNKIELKTLGNIYNTNISASAVLDNRLYSPYRLRNVEIKADYLDLDQVFDNFSKVTMPSPRDIQNSSSVELSAYINPAQVQIDRGSISAKEILIKGFPATDLTAHFKQDSDGVMRVDDFDFKIASGTVSANGQYDFKSSVFKGDCIAKSIDANKFSQIFLNIKNQIFGDLDGTVNFQTQGASPDERLKNLDCKVGFVIKDGKMPKLGSLEYLLRAGNVVKSGITGFTVNNIIELLVPIKTGEFSIIRGNVLVENGNASDIKIYSKGKNLSLYITGSADLVHTQAQMVVYGRLAKKVSTLLGPIGNTSLNTLFNLIPGIKLSEAENSVLRDINKIPGLDISSENYRFFSATIDGDIDGENYVKTFKWLE